MVTDFYDIEGKLNIWAERVFALGSGLKAEGLAGSELEGDILEFYERVGYIFQGIEMCLTRTPLGWVLYHVEDGTFIEVKMLEEGYWLSSALYVDDSPENREFIVNSMKTLLGKLPSDVVNIDAVDGEDGTIVRDNKGIDFSPIKAPSNMAIVGMCNGDLYVSTPYEFEDESYEEAKEGLKSSIKCTYRDMGMEEVGEGSSIHFARSKKEENKYLVKVDFSLDCDISQFIKIYREHTQPWVWTSMKKSSEEISLYGEFKVAEKG